MKIIEKLTDMMEDEMSDAEKYIECAMKYKDDDMILSKMFSDLSADELKHASMLHENSLRLISEYKQKGNEVPDDMQAVYNYLHDKLMARYNKIKFMQTTFRA